MRSPHSGAGARYGRLNRVLAPLLTLTLLGAGAAACGTSSGSSGGGKITLQVNVFGDFGYKDLYAQYEKAHPNITIKEKQSQYADHHKNLVTHLATGAGAGDVEAIEVGYINTFTAEPDKFVNLLDQGAASLQSQYLPWKWDQGLSADKKSLIGLGTDVGSMAMCYRTDLFAKAGLPTDRAKVSALWGTWQQYIDTGKKFMAKNPGKTDPKWFDASGNMFSALVGQADEGVYSPDGKIVAATNPAIKQAFDTTATAIQANESAKLAAFSPEWTTGFAKGTFATIVCPAWMTAYIQTNAKDASGKWDIAAAPGGGGNFGGSHLAVPKMSKHPKEAVDLVKFLTAPEQQKAVFKVTGNFPSMPALYDEPDVANFSKPYFNNAPQGKIFGDAAKALKPQYLGPKNGDVMTAIGQGLGRIEQGKQNPQQAWEQALKDVEKIK
jgi:cellobiose transport system substrate-binding protein